MASIERPGMSGTTERKRFRFSLKTLLLITILALCIGAYLAGYRDGYKASEVDSQAEYVIWKSPAK
jgi:hypothetical protein